jgi:chromosome partitioning protein
MGYLIAVVNLKGGCGKSTIAVNLACALAGRRAKVALMDADMQGTATQYASSGRLPVQSEHVPLEDARDVDRWIRRVLSITADYVVLDAPSHVGTVTKAIVGISDLVLIPCTPSTADLIATIPAVDLVRETRAANRSDSPKCLLIPSRVDRRTVSGREIEDALKRIGEPVGPAIHQRAALVDAFTAGLWIGEFALESDAHEDFKTLAEKVRRMAIGK